MRGNFPWRQFPGVYCQGAISFEVIFWEQSSREQLSRHCSRDMELDRICYLGHFLPFYPTTTQKIKILKKSKKHLEILNHFTMCTKNYDQMRPQLVESLVIAIRAHLVKVYKNYASTLIIYKVNRHFSFLPITYFP